MNHTRPTFTLKQAREAVQARKAGVWDHPLLVRFGALSPDTEADAEAILDCVTESAAPACVIEALNEAQKLIRSSRHRFPKSIRHSDTFRLNVTAAAINTALAAVSSTP